MGLADLKNGMSIDASEGDTMLGQDLSPDAYIGPGNDGMQLSSLLSLFSLLIQFSEFSGRKQKFSTT